MFKKLIILLLVGFAIVNNISCAAAEIDEKSIIDKEKAENTQLLFDLLANGPGHIGNIELCLELGANVEDAINENGRTLLMVAVENGWSKETVELLLRNGSLSSINKEDSDGNTALMLANNRNSKYNDPILIKLDNDMRYDIVTLLINNGAMIPHTAIRGPIFDIWFNFDKDKNIGDVQLLIKNGININMQDDYGHTALIKACVNNCKDIVQLLISHGADVNIQTNSGYTALILTCLANPDFEIVQLLIRHRADVNMLNDINVTALMWACARNCTDIVQLLIDNQANINIQNKRGESALTWACNRGCGVGIVKLLVENGATVNIQDSENISRLLMMCELPHEL